MGTDFRYNTGATRVPWAAVGENYNVHDLMDRCVEHFKGGNSDIPSVDEIIMADTEAKAFCKALVK